MPRVTVRTVIILIGHDAAPATLNNDMLCSDLYFNDVFAVIGHVETHNPQTRDDVLPRDHPRVVEVLLDPALVPRYHRSGLPLVFCP